MNDRYDPERILAHPSRASIWIQRYFRQGAGTFVTAPLFLYLIFCIAVSAFGALFQALALVRASYAVFGAVGAFISISFGWMTRSFRGSRCRCYWRHASDKMPIDSIRHDGAEPLICPHESHP